MMFIESLLVLCIVFHWSFSLGAYFAHTDIPFFRFLMLIIFIKMMSTGLFANPGGI